MSGPASFFTIFLSVFLPCYLYISVIKCFEEDLNLVPGAAVRDVDLSLPIWPSRWDKNRRHGNVGEATYNTRQL